MCSVARCREEIARCRAEIAAIEAQIRAGHPDLQGAVPGVGRLVCGVNAAASQSGLGHRCATFGACATGRWRLGVLAQTRSGAKQAGIVARSSKARRGSAGRASGGRVMLLGESIRPFATFGLEALDGESGLFHRSGHEPADRMPLPAHGLHDLGNGGALGPLEHLDYLGRLAAPTHACGLRRGRGFLALGRVLGGGRLLARLAPGRRALGGLCATLGLVVALRLRRLRFALRGLWFGFRGVAQTLDPRPNALGPEVFGALAVGKALERHHTRQAVPGGYQALGGPGLGQLSQFLLAGEGVEWRAAGRRGFFCGAKRRDAVLFVDGENRHDLSPWCRASGTPCACPSAPTAYPPAALGQQCYNVHAKTTYACYGTVTGGRCAVPGDWAAIDGGGATSCSAPGANWLTCAISGGALTLGAATGQTSHKVIGTCGSATSFVPCSLVAGDLPSIPLSTGVTGTLPAANLPAPGGGGPPGGLAALTSSTGGLGNGETTVVSYLIPSGTIQAGTTYRIRAFGTCSSTVASNTSHFYIRYGSADSSSDTALYSPTLTSTTGASAIPFAVDMIVTFQSTTVSQAQYAYWQTGASGLTNTATVIGSPNQVTGLTTTGNNYLQLSYYSLAATTGANIYLATIELVKP